MRRKSFWSILVLISVLFLACNAQVKNQSSEWKEFVSEEGNFKLKFPQTPEQTTRISPFGDGKIQHPKIEVSLPKMNFSVFYGDIPDLKDLNDDELKSYYEFLQEKTVKLNSSQLISKRQISIDNKAGYEFVESRNDKLVTYKLLLIKKRLYQLKTEIYSSLKNDSEVEKDIEKFFSSFQIIKD